jgi:hypothetical protein
MYCSAHGLLVRIQDLLSQILADGCITLLFLEQMFIPPPRHNYGSVLECTFLYGGSVLPLSDEKIYKSFSFMDGAMPATVAAQSMA